MTWAWLWSRAWSMFSSSFVGSSYQCTNACPIVRQCPSLSSSLSLIVLTKLIALSVLFNNGIVTIHAFSPSTYQRSSTTGNTLASFTTITSCHHHHHHHQKKKNNQSFLRETPLILWSSAGISSSSSSNGIAYSDDSNKDEEDEDDTILDCLILGGGISGSTLAHNLFYSGTTNILLAEARDYLGGNVRSRRLDDVGNNETFIWEDGPNSFATQPSIVRIAYELGIDTELVFANERLPPWVYYNGKIHPLPKGNGGKGVNGQLELLFGPNGIFKFGFTSELLSWPGKIRAGIGALIGHSPPPSSSSSSSSLPVVLQDKDNTDTGTGTGTGTDTGSTVAVEETIQEWVTRILGEEVFYRCIDPFVSGVYAGDPSTLSVKAALPKIARIEDISYSIDWNKVGGALLYGGIKRQIEVTKERKANPPAKEWVEFEYGNPGSFKMGLSTLPNAIYNELGPERIKLSWKVISVVEKIKKGNNDNIDDYRNSYNYEATFETTSPENGIKQLRTVRAHSVVSTLPAHSLDGIFTSIMPEVDEICTCVRDEIKRVGIYYPPVAAVTVAYPKTAFKEIQLQNGFGMLHDLPGFGNLNPRSEGIRTLGTLWTSSLFPQRAPPTYNLLLNYIGGSRDVAIGTMSEEEIIAEVDKGCRTVLLKEDAPPPKVLGIKIWPTAIPQYEKGHFQLIQKLENAEKFHPGLWICGNYRTGVAFPDCVTFGYDHAAIVNEYISRRRYRHRVNTNGNNINDKINKNNNNNNSNQKKKNNGSNNNIQVEQPTSLYFATEKITTDLPQTTMSVDVDDTPERIKVVS